MELLPAYPIETERLRLRPFVRGDVDAVHAYRSREDVTRFLPAPPLSREACAEFVQRRVNETSWAADGDRLFLAVELGNPGVLIGEVVLILRDSVSLQAELGYTFNPDFHGKGYATEAGARLLRLGFEEGGAHRIEARCSALNDASRRVMERLGMRPEAHFRDYRFIKGAWDDELVYAILEDEWRGRNAH